MAWKWFDEKKAVKEVNELRANTGHLPAVPEPLKEVYQALPDVSGSALCFGCTGYIGTAVIFDAVRRGIKVTVFIRQQSVDRFNGHLKDLKIQDRVTLVTGEVTDPAAVDKAMSDTKAECVISLLASPQITDEQDIYDVDYTASHTVVQAARKNGVKQFIYCSDTGVYQPTLCTQFHKLHIEGELMRCLPDGMQYTIIRPTTYHPYVVSAIVLDEVRKGQAVPLFGSADNAGNLALYNPIAREDLGRFIVSCINNQNTYGRVMAVGGPWSADNLSTLGDTTKWMIDMGTPAGKKPSTIKPLGMKLSEIIYEFMKAIGHFSPTLKRVATIVFFYTKYWSTVSHFSPGTGVYDCKSYTKELVDAAAKDPAAFEEFIKKAKSSTTGSVVYPTPLNSWWDITQKSLNPDQIPMGAGKPSVLAEVQKAEDLDAESLTKLHTMAPICIGKVPDSLADESDSEWIMEDGEESESSHQ
jgi:nucleoside-diphosphate-sugar epimerase